MCGSVRLSQKAGLSSLRNSPLRVTVRGAPTGEPDYNVAPTKAHLTRFPEHKEDRELRLVKWGLVQRFGRRTHSGGARMIRRVDLRTGGRWSSPLSAPRSPKRRCLIPADGYYEMDHGGEGPRSLSTSTGRTAASSPFCRDITSCGGTRAGPRGPRRRLVLGQGRSSRRRPPMRSAGFMTGRRWSSHRRAGRDWRQSWQQRQKS